jgi:hypothetical protein
MTPFHPNPRVALHALFVALLACCFVAFARADLMVVQSGAGGGSPSAYDIQLYNNHGVFRYGFTGNTEGWTGICAGPNGKFYALANIIGYGEINVFDAQGTVLRLQPGGVVSPGDLTFGPDGNIYVTGSLNGSWEEDGRFGVAKIDGQSGAYIGAFVDPPAGYTNALSRPVFGPDGNLVVIRSDGIARYDGATGAFIKLLVPVGTGGLAEPSALIFGPDGVLFVGSATNHSVLKFDGNTGTFLSTFIAPGAGGLNNPRDFAYGPDGRFYVASFGSNQVLRYDATTGAFVDVFVGSGMLVGPRDLAFTDTPPANDTVWFDDSLPAGARTMAAGGDSWNWVTGPTYSPRSGPLSGSRAHQSALAAGLHEHAFTFAQPFVVNAGETIKVWVHIDEANRPREMMLSFNAGGSWEHRAYWGENLINAGVNGTASRRRIGDIYRDSTDAWMLLAIPVDELGLAGKSIVGMSFSLYGGRVTWDRVFTSPPLPPRDTQPPQVRFVSPVDGATVSGMATLEAAATDASGIRSVRFEISEDGFDPPLPMIDAPYRVTWDFSYRPSMPVTLKAIATDNAGNQATATITVDCEALVAGPVPTGLWFTDALPAGAWTSATGGDIARWALNRCYPAPYENAKAHNSSLEAGIHEHSFAGVSPAARMTVPAGAVLFAYVYIPRHWAPRELMLSWSDGASWEHRAYWGENLIGHGTNNTAGRRFMGPLPATDQWVRLEIPASAVGLEGRQVSGMSFSLYDGFASWSGTGVVAAGSSPDEPPVEPPPEEPLPDNATVWFDDAFPRGASVGNTNDIRHWQWMAVDPAPKFGSYALYAENNGGRHEQYFNFAWDPLTLATGDSFYIWVFVPTNSTTRQLVLSFCAGNWEHRAYWGTRILSYAPEGSAGQYRVGDMPRAGAWTRLEVPASAIGLEGKSVVGLSLTLSEGVVIFDQAGKLSP